MPTVKVAPIASVTATTASATGGGTWAAVSRSGSAPMRRTARTAPSTEVAGTEPICRNAVTAFDQTMRFAEK